MYIYFLAPWKDWMFKKEGKWVEIDTAEFIVFPLNLFICLLSVIDSNGKHWKQEINYNKSNIFYSRSTKMWIMCGTYR